MRSSFTTCDVWEYARSWTGCYITRRLRLYMGHRHTKLCCSCFLFFSPSHLVWVYSPVGWDYCSHYYIFIFPERRYSNQTSPARTRCVHTGNWITRLTHPTELQWMNGANRELKRSLLSHGFFLYHLADWCCERNSIQKHSYRLSHHISRKSNICCFRRRSGLATKQN